jgi:hypothetical protein
MPAALAAHRFALGHQPSQARSRARGQDWVRPAPLACRVTSPWCPCRLPSPARLQEKAWRHLVPFSTVTGGKPLGGSYAFVEDFQRDKVSTTKARAAAFGNGWVRTPDGRWVALARARFTADSNPVTNIDAAGQGGRFSLATGGATRNTGATLELPADESRNPPAGLPSLEGKQTP